MSMMSPSTLLLQKDIQQKQIDQTLTCLERELDCQRKLIVWPDKACDHLSPKATPGNPILQLQEGVGERDTHLQESASDVVRRIMEEERAPP